MNSCLNMYITLYYRKAHWYIAFFTIADINQIFNCTILWLSTIQFCKGTHYPSILSINPFATNEQTELARQFVLSLPQSDLASTYRLVFYCMKLIYMLKYDTAKWNTLSYTYCISCNCTCVPLGLAVRGLILSWYREGKTTTKCYNLGHWIVYLPPWFSTKLISRKDVSTYSSMGNQILLHSAVKNVLCNMHRLC
jgi:hypothetical protein